MNATEADVLAFKLVNEAYRVLGDAAKRRDYDSERAAAGGPASGASLRVRNEGSFGGFGPVVQRPTSVYDAPADWASVRGSGPNELSTAAGEFDSASAFRQSMVRANERQKDSARVRAAMARMNRPRISVTPTGMGFGATVAGLGIWLVNYVFFM
jgi:curved DNA-binding protein CbpA